MEQETALQINEDFLQVSTSNEIYFGGDQAWLHTQPLQKVGCGIITAANIYAYTQGIKTLSLTAYSEITLKLASFMLPHEQLGIPSALYWMETFKGFLVDEGLEITYKWMTNLSSIKEFKDFIKETLISKAPLALLIYKNPKLPHFDWHWMTVTGYFIKEDLEFLEVSSWGQKHTINLDQVYNYSPYAVLIHPTLRP